MFKINENSPERIRTFADSIIDHFGEELLNYDYESFDDFSLDLDNAMQNGDVINIPVLDREQAFEMALDMISSENNSNAEGMDGDFDSTMPSAGFGTDEDYDMFESEFDDDDDEDDDELVSSCHGSPISWGGDEEVCSKCGKVLSQHDIISANKFIDKDDIDWDDIDESLIKESNEIIGMLRDSLASKKAKKLGLVHIGFGNYAEEPGESAQYKTVNGKLRKVGASKPKIRKATTTAQPQKAKEDDKIIKPQVQKGIKNVHRVSGDKFTYVFEKDGRKYKFTLTKDERKEFKGKGSIMDIIKKRIKKKEEHQKSKKLKKGKSIENPLSFK